jgi:hypothetical protein
MRIGIIPAVDPALALDVPESERQRVRAMY